MRFGITAAAAAMLVAAPAAAGTLVTFDEQSADLRYDRTFGTIVVSNGDTLAASDPANPFDTQSAGLFVILRTQNIYSNLISRVSFSVASRPGVGSQAVNIYDYGRNRPVSQFVISTPSDGSALNFDFFTQTSDRISIVTDGAIDNVSFEYSSVVPEPATWATMVAGFGVIGGTLRRRSKAKDLAPAAL